MLQTLSPHAISSRRSANHHATSLLPPPPPLATHSSTAPSSSPSPPLTNLHRRPPPPATFKATPHVRQHRSSLRPADDIHQIRRLPLHHRSCVVNSELLRFSSFPTVVEPPSVADPLSSIPLSSSSPHRPPAAPLSPPSSLSLSLRLVDTPVAATPHPTPPSDSPRHPLPRRRFSSYPSTRPRRSDSRGQRRFVRHNARQDPIFPIVIHYNF